MTELDVSRAPVGVIAAQRLIEAVAELGDLAERHYLELKSTLDLSTKKDREKIAKFILGASNRMPDVASTAFEGYGVMVVGVSKGAISGIPPVEMMDIAKVVQQFVGAGGPHWDVVWVPVAGSKSQVLVVLVDPPKLGHGPSPCRANGESLSDGRIYIRTEGETREANSAEVDLLLSRAIAPNVVEVDFGFEVIGEVVSVEVDEAKTKEEYLGRMRARLLHILPKEETVKTEHALTGLADYRSALSGLSAMALAMTNPETRTRDEYLRSIDTWEERFRDSWPEAIRQIAASQLVPSIIRITNRTTTFFHDVQVRLHLAGPISAVDFRTARQVRHPSDVDLPSSPREWGPTQRSFGMGLYPNIGPLYPRTASSYLPPSISYENGGSVSLNLRVGDLRPRGVYESEGEEIVFLVDDPSIEIIAGSWEMTARDHNEVFTGEFEVEVRAPRDLTAAVRTVLRLDSTQLTEEH